MIAPVLRTLSVRLGVAALVAATCLAVPTAPRAVTCSTAALLEVAVASSTGNPVAGTLVEAWTANGRVRGLTDAYGTARLRLPMNTCSGGRFHVRAPQVEPPVAGSFPITCGVTNTAGQGGPQVLTASLTW